MVDFMLGLAIETQGMEIGAISQAYALLESHIINNTTLVILTASEDSFTLGNHNR
jgi:hypothetical protein